MHVISWSDGSSVLHSVTVLTGPCITLFDDAFAARTDPTQALAWRNSTAGSAVNSTSVITLAGGVSSSSSSSGRCNVFTSGNSTLLRLLLDQGALSSREQLLVLVQDNVTLHEHKLLGPGGRIRLGRPVALAGFYTVPTGIDFHMEANLLVSDCVGTAVRLGCATLCSYGRCCCIIWSYGNGSLIAPESRDSLAW